MLFDYTHPPLIVRPARKLIPPATWTALAAWIATGCCMGFVPWTPGTWASLAATGIGWLLMTIIGWHALPVALICTLPIGLWAVARMLKEAGTTDPSYIVIDEIIGQWIVLCVAPLDWKGFALSFALFRLFDIWRPFPIRMIEKCGRSAAAVICDDVVAAVMAIFFLALLVVAMLACGVTFPPFVA